ncbi:MAG: hypothetical protein ABH851_00520 [Methanobacteriota archaeon]
MALRQTGGTPKDFEGAERIVEAFGVKYAHVETPYADLFFTRFGWPNRQCLTPENCLPTLDPSIESRPLGGTGTVYYVKTKPVQGKSLEIVLKWSRFGREIPFEELENVYWNSPWEEFGTLMQMRESDFGDPSTRMYGQRPLEIVCPKREVAAWSLGRQNWIFDSKARHLAQDQVGRSTAESVTLEPTRNYALIYGWEGGKDIFQWGTELGWPDEKMLNLSNEVAELMDAKGFQMLDQKPSNFVLRVRDGEPLRRRDGRLVAAVIDHELLLEKPEHRVGRMKKRRLEYFRHLAHVMDTGQPTELADNERSVTYEGVPYVFGGLEPSDAVLGVVGRDRYLLDYFRPEAWANSPSTGISHGFDLRHVRTKDGVHIAVQTSRFGLDPQNEYPSQLPEDIKFNDPMREVAIAQKLREKGVNTVHPRALVLTNPEVGRTILEGGQLDLDVLQPGQAQIIWGYWKGIDPLEGYKESSNWGHVDLEYARDTLIGGEGVISKALYEELLGTSREKLIELGVHADEIQPYQLVMTFNDQGELVMGRESKPKILYGIDNFKAVEFGLLPADVCAQLVDRETQKVAAAEFTNHNPYGQHLILTYDPETGFRLDEDGLPFAVHCMFDLHKPIQGELF